MVCVVCLVYVCYFMVDGWLVVLHVGLVLGCLGCCFVASAGHCYKV